MTALQHDLNAHNAGVAAYEEMINDPKDPCSCDTCVVRVILEAAWPHLVLAAREDVDEQAARQLALSATSATCEASR
jgi:hypothetical protein